MNIITELLSTMLYPLKTLLPPTGYNVLTVTKVLLGLLVTLLSEWSFSDGFFWVQAQAVCDSTTVLLVSGSGH